MYKFVINSASTLYFQSMLPITTKGTTQGSFGSLCFNLSEVVVDEVDGLLLDVDGVRFERPLLNGAFVVHLNVSMLSSHG